jgi:hypothetical protein
MTLIWRPGYITTFADPDVQSYLTRVEEADNQRLEYPVAVAIDEFIRGCKADGIWNAIKASCIMAGARTLAGALVPLVGPAPTNFNFVAGDYNRKTGLVSNGTTKYLDSNRNNNADPQNNNHIAIATSVEASGSRYVSAMAASVGGTRVSSFIVASRSTSSSLIAGSVGFSGISRIASGSYTARSNFSNTTISVASQAPSSGNYFVFANNTGAGADAYSAIRAYFYSIGESLDLALLDARITTLINAFAVVIP